MSSGTGRGIKLPRSQGMRECSCVIMTAAAKHPALSRIQQRAEDRQALGSRLAQRASTYFAVPKEIKLPMLSELGEATGSSDRAHQSSIRSKMLSRGSRVCRLPRVLTCYLAIVRTSLLKTAKLHTTGGEPPVCKRAVLIFLGTGQRGYLHPSQYHNLPGVSSEYQRCFTHLRSATSTPSRQQYQSLCRHRTHPTPPTCRQHSFSTLIT